MEPLYLGLVRNTNVYRHAYTQFIYPTTTCTHSTPGYQIQQENADDTES